MALSASTVWEVRADGNSANGGGFDSSVGSPGTDYSQQASPQVTFTDMVIDAVDNTKFTSAGTSASSVHPGNILNVTSGSGFTTGRYCIVSQAAGVYTVDRAMGTVGSVNGNGRLGGAADLIASIDQDVVAGNTIFIDSDGGTFTRTSTETITLTGTAAAPIKVVGYTSTRTAAMNTETKPTFTSATNSVAIMTMTACVHTWFYNLKFTHTAATRGNGWVNAGTQSTDVRWYNCEADGCLNGWLAGSSTATSWTRAKHVKCVSRNSTVSGYSTANLGLILGFSGCWFDSNASHGFSSSGTTPSHTLDFDRCAFTDNTADGLNFASTTGNITRLIMSNCTIEGNGSDGLDFAFTTGVITTWDFTNNIIYGNTSTGIKCTTAGQLEQNLFSSDNAYGGNGANFSNFTGTADNVSAALGDPFTNSGSDDYTLNNTASAGASCRASGFPARVGSNTYSAGTNYLDIGALQHQESAGGGGGPLIGPGRLVRN